MSEAAYIVLAGITTWRLAHMLQEEDGPASVFARLRAYIASKYGYKSGGIYDGYTCMYCLSVWISLIISIVIGTSMHFFIEWLSISSIAIFTSLVHDKLEQ